MVTGYFNGKRSRRFRSIMGLSLGDVAAKVGVAQDTIRAWEAGRFEPDEAQLARLAEIYRCETDYLRKW